MRHAYRIVLIFSIVIQLSAFFIVVAVALWIDQVYNGEIARLTKLSVAFRASMMSVAFLSKWWIYSRCLRAQYRVTCTSWL